MMNKFRGRDISVAEMLRAHRAFVPLNDHLMKDIMTAKERKKATASLLPASVVDREDEDRVNQELMQNLDAMFQQYDNPVVDPKEPWTPTQSSINISGLRDADKALGMSELQTTRETRREQLMRELAEIEAADRTALGNSAGQLDLGIKPVTRALRSPPPVLSMGTVQPRFQSDWAVIPPRDDSFHARHASGNFMKGPSGGEAREGGTGQIRVQTHQLVITNVERATQDNLLLMKKEIEKAIKLGHEFTLEDRAWIEPAARRAITDTLKRHHLVQSRMAE
jgi:hypothetical protein